MTDTIPAPLADFAGAVPPAPAWFTAAIAAAPERSTVTVAGAALEVLTWGERGKPGLLFLHGNGAHAGWWNFIAPFFAADFRVVAFSWSGMGGSDHRPAYSVATFVAEIAAVIAATGVADTGPPRVVGHSFGGFPMMAAAGPGGLDLAAVVIVDTPFRSPGESGGARPPSNGERAHRIYPDLTAALARFRFAPPQGCANPFIADWIARGSLKQVASDAAAGGGDGWTWRFDPLLWSRVEIADTRALLDGPCGPVALIWGERSILMPPDRVAAMRAALPPGSPAIAIPDAEHHVMVDQPLAFVAALRALFAAWPAATVDG